MTKRSHNYSGYKGNYWAIVLGPKGNGLIPLPLFQFVRTSNKAQFIERAQAVHRGMIVRAIPQPIPPVFRAGM